MSDPYQQPTGQDPYGQPDYGQGGYGQGAYGQPTPVAPYVPQARYVPPTLNEIWYKAGINMLLYFFTCGIWGAAWAYRTHDDLQKHNGDGLGGTIALILCLLGGALVVCFTIPMELEKAYTRNGWASPVKTTDGLWILVPFAGPFLWYSKVQKALNDYWVSQGSQPLAA